MAVAQLAERRDVAPEVAGSSPVGHPRDHRGASTTPRTHGSSVLRPLGLGCSTGASSSTAEQRTLNPQVPGSNPGGRTSFSDFLGSGGGSESVVTVAVGPDVESGASITEPSLLWLFRSRPVSALDAHSPLLGPHPNAANPWAPSPVLREDGYRGDAYWGGADPH